MPYLHLPVQSGSDRVLRAMNRKHTAQQYIDLIAKVRAARADIAISGDFIVGFPDESEAEFQETLQLVKEIQYASAFTFAYSSRPGTPAANHQAQISDEVKKQRLHALQALIIEQTASFNSQCLGRKLSVLAEKPGRYEGQLIGRSPYLQSVHFEAPLEKIGQICEIEIEAVGPNSLSGYYGGN
jgi:tRNA-2-methylthio-N6-dimethylallyladenosine synthase